MQSVLSLLPDIIEAGFDILNPVQCSAAGMDPKILKEKFGDRLTFWGGGIDTQKTLPFGTPEEVRRQVRERIGIFSANGGFVFSAVHNVQANIPLKNLLALYETVCESAYSPSEANHKTFAPHAAFRDHAELEKVRTPR